MAANNRNYSPDYAIPPGITLLETLEALGITQAKLARRTGRPLKTINEIIKGKAAITPETALQLENVLGVPASFWNNRERQYRETLACLEQNQRLANDLGWLRSVPVKDLVKAGWVRRCSDKLEQLREVLKFFAIASPAQWPQVEVLYRRPRKFASKPAALMAWLRQGEIEGQAMQCRPYDEAGFQAALVKARRLTRELPSRFQPRLTAECAEAGVAVVFVPALPGARACGATRWLTPRKALLQLSLRYKTNDMLWFTFFHEAGHIVLHSKKEVFIEGEADDGAREREADEFAQEMLIPKGQYRRFIAAQRFDRGAVIAFADKIGVAPGIVIGRLQDDGILKHSKLNDPRKRPLVRQAIRDRYLSGPTRRREAMRAVVGIWKDRSDLPDTESYVRRLRKGSRIKRVAS